MMTSQVAQYDALKAMYQTQKAEALDTINLMTQKIQQIEAAPDFAVNRAKYMADFQTAFATREMAKAKLAELERQYQMYEQQYLAQVSAQKAVAETTIPKVQAENVIVSNKAISTLSPTAAAMVTKQAVSNMTQYKSQIVDEKLTNSMMPGEGVKRLSPIKTQIASETAAIPTPTVSEAEAIKSLEEKTGKMNLAILGTGLAALFYIFAG